MKMVITVTILKDESEMTPEDTCNIYSRATWYGEPIPLNPTPNDMNQVLAHIRGYIIESVEKAHYIIKEPERDISKFSK